MPPPTLTELFRLLSSFDPPRAGLQGAPWEAYVDWSIAQGLAPLAAYNLEYRLGGVRVPDWVRDRLLSVYQGSVNDNVMKLVNFKRAVDALEGRTLVLLGAGSFAEALYPHIAFRPVIDLSLFLPPGDLDGFVGWLRRAEFRPGQDLPAPKGSRVLTDGRTFLYLYGELSGDRREDQAILERAVPMKVFGPSVKRLELEDALLAQAVTMARAGYDVPMIELVDLRELVLGAPSMAGPYSRQPDAASVLLRAKTWKAERALFTSLGIVARLFPETEVAVARLRPQLSLPVREVLERAVVGPVAEVGRMETFRGEDTLRHLLAGG